MYVLSGGWDTQEQHSLVGSCPRNIVGPEHTYSCLCSGTVVVRGLPAQTSCLLAHLLLLLLLRLPATSLQRGMHVGVHNSMPVKPMA